jgi:hypothetical protein
MRFRVFRQNFFSRLFVRQKFQEHLVLGIVMGFGEAFPEQAQVFLVNVSIHTSLPGGREKWTDTMGSGGSRVVVNIEQSAI